MIVYGSELSKEIKEDLKKEIAILDRKPCLAVVLVGDNKASISYVKSKKKASEEVGIDFRLINLLDTISEEELIKEIEVLNNNQEVDGILVQLPLPKHISERNVLNTIKPDKDVDGLNIINAGKLFLNEDGFVPCTPLGIMKILDKMGVDLCGKNAVVIGRSNLVGLPIARLLTKANATVTICHSKTENLKEIVKKAEVVIVAIGKAKMIDESYLNENAYVVDVGINHLDGKLCGDVDFEAVYDKVKAITPVPKGVGPMTVTSLLENVYKAYKIHEVVNDREL